MWTFEPPLSRGREQQVGTPVPLAYRPDAPDRTARRTGGLDAYFHWVLIAVGVVAAVFNRRALPRGNELLRRGGGLSTRP